MNAKKTIFQVVYFIFVTLFVLAFSLCFGFENAFIGVMAVVLCIFLIKKDLKQKLSTNFLKILFTNLLIGFSAFLVYFVPVATVIIIFVVIFLICVLTKDVENKLYYPFALEFVYLLAQGISIEDLPIRLLALVASTIFIIGVNAIIHRKKAIVKKEGPKTPIKEKILSKFKKDEKHYLFSLEMAILITIFESIGILLAIPNFKWLSVTTLSIVQPNTNVAVKGFNRIKGTVIGVTIFIIMDLLVLNNLPDYSLIIAAIMLIISTYMYTGTYIGPKSEYYVRMIWSSLLALSSAYLTFSQSHYVVDRIAFIVLATVICLGINYLMRKSTKI